MVELDLTPAERDVFALMGEGLSDEEIALRLIVSVNTVKFHVRNIREKCGGVGRGERFWLTIRHLWPRA